MIDSKLLESKRKQIENKVAELLRTIPLSAGGQLVCEVRLHFIPPPVSVVVEVKLPEEEEVFPSGRGWFLKRDLAAAELEQLRLVPWSGVAKTIAGFILERGNAETRAREICEKLEGEGFPNYGMRTLPLPEVNQLLKKYAPDFQFTTATGGSLSKIRYYRFYRRLSK